MWEKITSRKSYFYPYKFVMAYILNNYVLFSIFQIYNSDSAST